MIEKKTDKQKVEQKPRDDGIELENQFIIRVPEDVAKVLHEALETGNLKDRLTIQMDNDLRYGEIRFDHWLLHSKIVDLPTIIECLKTIDSKSFYKSADICQIMICKEEPDVIDPEKESPNKGKKKDPNKVDKKYLWPHGITPPCKNIRKRRFRKTLKKKNVEAPEIEKEVKRLLRSDNEAVKVDFEVINEELEKASSDTNAKEYQGDEEEYNEDTINASEKLNDSLSHKDLNIESEGDDTRPGETAISGVGEHDIFGEEVSSSDDEDEDERRNTRQEIEEISRLSGDDSHLSDYSEGGGGNRSTLDVNNGIAGSSSDINISREDPTEFNKSMFGGNDSPKGDIDGSSSNLASTSNYFDLPKVHSVRNDYEEDSYTDNTPQLNPEEAALKIEMLKDQYSDLKLMHNQKAQEISSIQNPTLRQRLQDTLDNLLTQMLEKEIEIKSYENML